jgi:hypothetical protein
VLGGDGGVGNPEDGGRLDELGVDDELGGGEFWGN